MITSIILEWFDCSCHCAEDLSRTKITIYRNKKHVVYEEYDGWDNVLRKQEGDFPKHIGDRFFYVLEEVNAELTRSLDWRVEVCDGSCWEMKIRHTGNKLQKLVGTVEFPPHGRRIEKEIIHLCEEANLFEPQLFGCGEISWRATREFTDKWLDIFTSQPPEADSLFEAHMGNDCLALGFDMDCGKAFEAKYRNDRLIYSLDDFKAIIGEVDDVELLGSAIISNWRRITHWSYESGFSDTNKAWFLLALNRLKELVTC